MCPFGAGFFFKLSMSSSFTDCVLLLLVILKYFVLTEEICLVYSLSTV